MTQGLWIHLGFCSSFTNYSFSLSSADWETEVGNLKDKNVSKLLLVPLLATFNCELEGRSKVS